MAENKEQDLIQIAHAAIDLMTWFHEQAEPDDTPDMNATFPAVDFKRFVDEHARLMFRITRYEKLPTEPAYLRLRTAANELCAVLGMHGEISARDDRVRALMDAIYGTDDGSTEKAKPVCAQPALPGLSDARIYEFANAICTPTNGGWQFADGKALMLFARALLAQAAPPATAMRDDDLWHIAGVVTSLNGGNLFNVSQRECVTAIRAAFMDPDAGRAFIAAQTAEPVPPASSCNYIGLCGCKTPCDAKNEQPILSDADIYKLISDAEQKIPWSGRLQAVPLKTVAELVRHILAAQRQGSDKDAERYRKAIAYEDNAGLLYCAVMNHCPDKAAIDAEFDAEAIDIAIANGAPT